MLSARAILSVVLAVIAVAASSLAGAERIAYHDGSEIGGTIVGIDDEAVRLASSGTDGVATTKSIALYEIGSIQFHGENESVPRKAVEDVPGPAVCFRSGQLLAGNVVETRTDTAGAPAIDVARVLSEAGPLDVPLELLWGFRLQRPHRADELFRSDLASAIRTSSDPTRSSTEPEDRIYVVRGRQLLKVAGTFRHLDDKVLSMEYGGKTRRIPRSRVFGVILAPVATRRVESGYPAVCRLRSGDELPAMIVGMARSGDAGERQLLLRFRGSHPRTHQSVPVDRIDLVRFFSDRVAFLSDLAPVRARESSAVGATTAFPWRRDRATSGGGLELAGKTYRKGLGVHSYSSLEFDIGGRYSSFAATIGLIDRTPESGSPAARPAGVTFRVLADGKVLFEKELPDSAKPEHVLLPVPGIERLRLEVDYGKDGFDFGDHAAWAEARVIKE